MPNRQLTKKELETFAYPLLRGVREQLKKLAKGKKDLHWALRRKLYKELIYDERGKPMQRRALKAAKRLEQNDLCAKCGKRLPVKGAVLDRFQAMDGYTPNNTRLLCPKCDTKVQEARGYQ